MVKEYLKLCRIEFAGFLISTILAGALCIHGEGFGLLEAFHLIIIGVLFNNWGFVHNDLYDLKLDALSKDLSSRPLVAGTINEQGAKLFILATLATLTLWLFFTSTTFILSMMIMALAILCAGTYNMFSKSIPGLDFIFALSSALLCFLGGVYTTPISTIPAENFQTLIMVSFFIFIEFSIFNMGSTLKDVENDYTGGAKNISMLLGVKVNSSGELHTPVIFKAILLFLKLCSIGIVLFLTSQLCGTVLQLIIICVCGLSFFATYKSISLRLYDRQKFGKLWVQQDATSKCILPLLFIPIAGYYWFSLLLLLPVFWFLFFIKVLYGSDKSLHKGF